MKSVYFFTKIIQLQIYTRNILDKQNSVTTSISDDPFLLMKFNPDCLILFYIVSSFV